MKNLLTVNCQPDRPTGRWPTVADLASPVVGSAGRLQVAGRPAVRVRPIQPNDAEAEQAFVRGLSLASRHHRFHVGLRQLSPSLLQQMTQVDQHDHVAWVAVLDEPSHPRVADAGLGPNLEAGRIVADARYVRLPSAPSAPHEAEFAIAVADDWQSRGLGRQLIGMLARHAARQGLQALVGDVLPENRRMLVLMRGLGAMTRPHPDGPQMVQIVLPVHTAALQEMRPATASPNL